MYILKDDDELIMTGKQIREYKDIVEKKIILEIANKELKINDWRPK